MVVYYMVFGLLLVNRLRQYSFVLDAPIPCATIAIYKGITIPDLARSKSLTNSPGSRAIHKLIRLRFSVQYI